MDKFIANLNDTTAIRVLTTISRQHLKESGPESALSADQKETLKIGLGVGPAQVSVSDGEMARQALLILAQDTEKGPMIKMLAEQSSPQRFAESIAVAGLTAALVFVLKTEMEFVRDKKGKWTIRILSIALDMELLKGFVSRLLSWIPGGPFKP